MPVLQSNITCQMPAVCYGMEKNSSSLLYSMWSSSERMDWILDLNSDGATFTGNVNAGFCHAIH